MRSKLPRSLPLALRAFILLAVTFYIYLPALHGDWGDDDDLYFAQNPLRNDPHHIEKIWLKPGSFIEYYPITESLQALQWHLWHGDTFGYLLTNVLLHSLNALLLWHLLSKLCLRFAWLGALLWAIHPANVESVAWISELKNTLAMAPALLALCAWIDFEEQGRGRDYWRAFALFVVSMLCKISMTPLPLFLLLYAWWKRRRIAASDLLHCIPFLLVSVTLAWVTHYSGERFGLQYPAPVPPIPVGDLFSRLALIGSTGAFYFWKFLWPWPLSPAYPQWSVLNPSPWLFIPWLLLALSTGVAWRFRETWGRHLVLGAGFFLLFLAPFLGFTGISYMTYTWVMDHFLYLPMIGLIPLVAAGLDLLRGRVPARLHLSAGCALAGLFLLLTGLSHAYAGIYSSQIRLFSQALRVSPGCRQARERLGAAFMNLHKYDSAIVEFQASLAPAPNDLRAVNEHVGLGLAFLRSGLLPEARDQFQAAIRIDDRFSDAYANLGDTLMRLGDLDGGVDNLRKAVALPGTSAQAFNALGFALLRSGSSADALVQFQKAAAIAADIPQVHDNLAIAYMNIGRSADGIREFRNALALNPGDPVAADALRKIGAGPSE